EVDGGLATSSPPQAPNAASSITNGITAERLRDCNTSRPYLPRTPSHLHLTVTCIHLQSYEVEKPTAHLSLAEPTLPWHWRQLPRCGVTGGSDSARAVGSRRAGSARRACGYR